MSSYAARGKLRTFQILFIRIDSGEPIDVTTPTIEVFHYDDIDGVTGQNKVVDVLPSSLVHDPVVGQYHYVWSVPGNKPLGQVHYARYSGTDPLVNQPINFEEEFAIIDDNPPLYPTCGGMTASFVPW
jgi:hypothetical protein